MSGAFDEKAVFLAALALEPRNRPAFLAGACPDGATRARIELLLHHHQATIDLASPAPAAVAGNGNSNGDAPDRIDEFTLERVLGEGGMGVVYLARDTQLGRPVALKVLAAHLTGSETALARFREEARAAAALNHPGIVPLFKLGFDGRRHYTVSEYIDGPTLRTVIDEAKPKLTGSRDARAWQRRCAEIVAAVADALESCHRAGIVHRDVKPSNILMDPRLGPRLTDFGIAKHTAQEARTQSGDLLGSCHYMSPEQASIASAGVDRRSDIFSLGVVLYEMLVFQRPFDGADLMAVLHAVIHTEPPPVRKLDRSIPRDLETICRKAMEKSPARRYQSAAHLAADLRCFLDGRPILAQPPSLGRRAAHWVHTRRRGAAAALLVAFALMLAGTGWLLREQRNEALAWVRVESDSPARVLIQGHDAPTLAPEPIHKKLGDTPTGWVRLPPGQYRLTVVRRSDGAFSEFNLLLRDTGRARARSLRVVDSADAAPSAAGDRVGVFALPDDVAAGMLMVRGGAFDLARESQAHACLRGPNSLASFLIDPTEVSNAQYREFVLATGHPEPHHWRESGYSDDIADLPVIWVSIEDAEAYARWRGKRLPTAVEWQAAARGKAGHFYPGGDTPPDSLPPPYPGDNSTPAAIIAGYLASVVPVDSPAPWDVAGAPLHMYSNVRELTATVDFQKMDVIMAGRGWSDRRNGTLEDASTTPAMSPNVRGGFRCAKSLEIAKETP